MVMKSIQSNAIVRIDPKPKSRQKSKALKDLLTGDFDEIAWCRLCERSHQHTLLINQISSQIKQHPDLINWIRAAQDSLLKDVDIDADADIDINVDVEVEVDTTDDEGKSWLPDGLVAELCACLKEKPEFKNMSGRAYTSAEKRVGNIYKSWFTSHLRLLYQIKGKRRWLAAVESDIELAKISNFSDSEIENKAEQILFQIKLKDDSIDELADDYVRKIFNILFQKLDATEDILSRRAVVLLLKNGGKVRVELKKPRKRKKSKKFKNSKNKYKPAMPKTLEERLTAKRVEIDRLEKQLLGQLPRERNLFPAQAFEESLSNLLSLPDPDAVKNDRYYFLVFALLIHQTYSCKNIYFEQHLLRSMSECWEEMSSLFYYRVLIFSFLLCASSKQKYLQLIRNLLGAIAIEFDRVDSQFADWHESVTPKIDAFLRLPKSLPYPIKFGYSDVSFWQSEEGKIFFKLNGWGDLIFEVHCHYRQLPLIKTFVEDWQTKKNSTEENPYSGSFMLLRSIELLWKPKDRSEHTTQLCSDCGVLQQHPIGGFWNECKLSVHWCFDSDRLTKQGLEKVRQRKLNSRFKKLAKKQEELQEKQTLLKQLEELPDDCKSETQSKEVEKLKKEIKKLKKEIGKLQTEIGKPNPKLECLRNSPLFDRPDLPLYEGISNIFVGVLLDLDKHIVVAVVDAKRRKILAIRQARSISKEGHELLQKYFRQRRDHSKQRKLDQKAHRHVDSSESKLGQQVARLFAKGVVELAQKYKASTIVIPITKGWRDRFYSQLVARARIKCKGVKKAMAKYTKEHSEKLHQWDYSRLSQAIIDCASTKGVQIIERETVYEEDAFKQAANLAIAVWDSLHSVDE